MSSVKILANDGREAREPSRYAIVLCIWRLDLAAQGVHFAHSEVSMSMSSAVPLMIGLGLAGIAAQAVADIETDRKAGECAGVLMISRSLEGAQRALSMADRADRASQFGADWMRRFNRASDDSQRKGMAFAAASACRDVGVRASDWINRK
ncbi:hypothetical protein [Ramlibacter sp.]|uniref:hypothetical protein n=1 Tax=Ramlibacter sp. TaxID=1917967 RepID=UPI002C93BAC4|nr:hypothetical protein [Ramlibacter sp.]HWI80390.1 hypothetical protein [Ramlibacter sp.]